MADASPNSGQRTLASALPVAVENVQVNFCRKPGCQNYGVPPDLDLPDRRGRRLPHDPDEVGRYALTGMQHETALRCVACNSSNNLYCNQAVLEEIQRAQNKAGMASDAACRNAGCENSERPIFRHPYEYIRYGTTKAGSQRFRCSRCGGTVTASKAQRRQKTPHLNPQIVADLVNNAALSGIIRKTGLSPNALYKRIDRIHRMMFRFEAHRLQKLRSLKRKKLFLSADYQDYLANWQTRKDRRTTQFTALGIAENLSGYVFANDLAYAPLDEDPWSHFLRLLREGDFDRPWMHRRSARYRIREFLVAARLCYEQGETKSQQDEKAHRRLMEMLQDHGYAIDEQFSVPRHGVMLDSTYVALARFQILDKLLPEGAHVHVYSDQDGAIRTGVLSGLSRRLQQNRLTYALVGIRKGLSIDVRRRASQAAKDALLEFCVAQGYDGPSAAARRAFIDEYAEEDKRANLPFTFHRLPTVTVYEPEKHVAVLHQAQGRDEQEHHALFLEALDRASLHGIDSFFGLLRSRVSFLHRAPQSAASGRNWYAFQPYDPWRIQQMLDIARIYFNYVEPRPRSMGWLYGEVKNEKKTPAERLGLANGPVELKKILYGDW